MRKTTIIEETGAVKKSVGDWKIMSNPLEWFHRHPKLGVRIGSGKIKFHIIKVDYSQISTLKDNEEGFSSFAELMLKTVTLLSLILNTKLYFFTFPSKRHQFL